MNITITLERSTKAHSIFESNIKTKRKFIASVADIDEAAIFIESIVSHRDKYIKDFEVEFYIPEFKINTDFEDNKSVDKLVDAIKKLLEECDHIPTITVFGSGAYINTIMW